MKTKSVEEIRWAFPNSRWGPGPHPAYGCLNFNTTQGRGRRGPSLQRPENVNLILFFLVKTSQSITENVNAFPPLLSGLFPPAITCEISHVVTLTRGGFKMTRLFSLCLSDVPEFPKSDETTGNLKARPLSLSKCSHLICLFVIKWKDQDVDSSSAQPLTNEAPSPRPLGSHRHVQLTRFSSLNIEWILELELRCNVGTRISWWQLCIMASWAAFCWLSFGGVGGIDRILCSFDPLATDRFLFLAEKVAPRLFLVHLRLPGTSCWDLLSLLSHRNWAKILFPYHRRVYWNSAMGLGRPYGLGAPNGPSIPRAEDGFRGMTQATCCRNPFY